ncbi:hypothetical protein EJ774_21270 [Pandoraea apista]|uniref:Uncharacterized protein n=1 Tax=Pandoraea apista TaxID=93218 RepID=A0ABX9ZLH7_9BURK|nr:hypothetical protein [Pandoraea apista]RSK77887.1 hypothetical protein EJE83_18035 [Pandoraea apista]RUN81874.1 hypothetical protein EJ774_21270 [Pandoraea apista]
MEMPELPQANDADMSAVFSAALSVLFATHPAPAALLAKWESVASQLPLMLMKNGASDVKHNANVVLAQGLLAIARNRTADESN